ncbi:hypothetical protein DdX_06041 [Ditylenchus destructor]|uniref:Transmembrane protein n=1 Tax=Ditylenchus destructor TaxID=166010 RepID=A0AAD4N8V2_9BILA|nr:hypothetical protein DdX_06041 [Ditylenchus destructor]
MAKPEGPPLGRELKRMQSNGKLSLKPSKKEDYFQCGFKLHVQSVAIIVAAIGICASVVKLIIWKSYSENVATLVFTVLVLCAHACILCAQQVRIAKLYVPYLVINPICLLLLIRFYIIPLIQLVASLPHLKAVSDQKYTEDSLLIQLAKPIAVLELVIFIVSGIALICFQTVIYRAYHYMTYSRQGSEEVYRNVYFIEPRKRLQRMNTFVA